MNKYIKKIKDIIEYIEKGIEIYFPDLYNFNENYKEDFIYWSKFWGIFISIIILTILMPGLGAVIFSSFFVFLAGYIRFNEEFINIDKPILNTISNYLLLPAVLIIFFGLV